MASTIVGDIEVEPIIPKWPQGGRRVLFGSIFDASSVNGGQSDGNNGNNRNGGVLGIQTI